MSLNESFYNIISGKAINGKASTKELISVLQRNDSCSIAYIHDEGSDLDE